MSIDVAHSRCLPKDQPHGWVETVGAGAGTSGCFSVLLRWSVGRHGLLRSRCTHSWCSATQRQSVESRIAPYRKTFKSEDGVPQKGGWLGRSRTSALAEQIFPADPLGCCGVSGLALAPGGRRAAEGPLPLSSAGPIAPGRGMFFHGFVWSVYSDRAESSGYSGSLGWQAHCVGAPASLHHLDTDPKQSESPHLRIVESALDL